MSDPRITIKFRADGAADLKKAIVELSVAQKRLEKGNAAAERMQKKLNRQIDEYNQLGIFGVRNTRNLSFSLSVLRSKLLIAAFGFATLNKTIGSFVRAQGEQELAEKKLEQALGKVNKGLLGQASALQKVTAFGDETIISAQALLAAFVKDEEQLKKATEATLDLASAKGMDLASAADLVGKTLGSSTNSLSRYGIQVEGAVGSTGRLNTLVNSIADAFGGQAKAQAETLTGSIEQMKNAIGDTSEAIGALMAPAVINIAKRIKSAAEAFTGFFARMRETGLETSIRRINELGGETLEIERKKLNLELLRAEVQTRNIESLSDLESKKNQELDAQIESQNKIKDKQFELEKDFGHLVEENLFGQLKLKQTVSHADMEKINNLTNEIALEEESIKQSEEIIEGLDTEIDKHRLVNDLKAQRNALDKETVDNNNKIVETFSMLGDFGDFQLPIPFIDNSDIERMERVKALMDDIKKRDEDKIKNEKLELKLQDVRLKNTDNIIKGLGAVAKMGQKTARQMANIQYGLAIIDAIRAGMATRKNLADDGFSFPIPQIAGALETAAMVAIATQIRAQQFETGGLVGGRRHSQGGTLIEAERGEFVMSRNAVQSIGVDNLEAMNQGGSAVNITITGNVMTSDFVEGELAEKIRDAVRTGTDFGMS